MPTVVDMGKAREEALFQLRLGRQSLAFGFLVGLLLIVDATIALLVGSGALVNQGKVGSFLQGLITNDVSLPLPLAAALFLSVAVFLEKWDTYGFWPFEDHFALTVASLGLSILLAVIYGLHFLGKGPDLLHLIGNWIFPLVLVALSLGMISLGTTWRGTGLRKVSSIVFGVLPPLLYFPLSTSLAFLGGAGSQNLTVSISFSFAAFLYTASGAQLHLMASATRAQEREVVAGSHEKLFQLSQELSQRAEASAFREEALSRREVDVEAQEATLVERARFLEDRRQELERLDQHLRGRSDDLSTREQGLLPKAAEVTALQASLKDREAKLGTRDREQEAAFQRLGDRERKMLEREQGLRQREVEVQTRATELSRQEAQSKVVDQTAQSRLSEAERRFAAATAKEAELRTREATLSVPPDARATLGAREADFGRREAALEAQRAEIIDRASALTEREGSLEKRRGELQQVASTVLEREKGVAKREAELAAKARQYEQELELLRGATKQQEEELRKSFDLNKRNTLAESQSTLKLQQIADREKTVNDREVRITDSERSLQGRREELERLSREVQARQQTIEAQAADLRMRSTRLEEAAARLAPSRTEADAALNQALKDREAALAFRERQLAEREQKLRAQAYERDKGPAASSLEEGPSILGAGPAQPVHRAGRTGTGTPRLDDLLLGGFPERAQVGFVGPAFVGKEVAIYSFIAEGLRHGECALIVATGRAPSEMAKELGVVIPSLMDYEGDGRVTWIDASNPSGTPQGDARSSRGTTVKGPGDLVEILKAIGRHAGEFEKRGVSFRVAFLSLSACMTQSDDKGAAAFVQNLLGILRSRRSVGAFSIDRGMHSVQQVEAIVSQMDGAVEFRSERGKTQLQVLGLGEVQSRQWVDYRFTQRSVQLGSFSLERIR